MSLGSTRDNPERKNFTLKFAKRLKEVRIKKNVSQEELAYKSGLNYAYVGHLERGIYSPTLYVVWRLAKALNVSLEQFLKDFPR